MSRNAGEPPKHGLAGLDRWADYLDWLREETIDTVDQLPDEQLRASILPSGWTPLELLSHLAHMEQRWFVWGFLAEPVDAPWGDWNVTDPTSTDDARWSVPPHVSKREVIVHLRASGSRTCEVLSGHPASSVARSGGRFDQEPPTLEWICFHVLAEYARHAGQLDVVVELLRADAR